MDSFSEVQEKGGLGRVLEKEVSMRELVWGSRGYRGGIGDIEGKKEDGTRGRA